MLKEDICKIVGGYPKNIVCVCRLKNCRRLKINKISRGRNCRGNKNHIFFQREVKIDAVEGLVSLENEYFCCAGLKNDIYVEGP